MKEEWKNEFEVYKSRIKSFYRAIGYKEKIALSDEELEAVFTGFKNFAEEGDDDAFYEVYKGLWDARLAHLTKIIKRDGNGENFTKEQKKEWEDVNCSYEVASYPLICSCCGVNKPNMYYMQEPSFTMAMMKIQFSRQRNERKQ